LERSNTHSPCIEYGKRNILPSSTAQENDDDDPRGSIYFVISSNFSTETTQNITIKSPQYFHPTTTAPATTTKKKLPNEKKINKNKKEIAVICHAVQNRQAHSVYTRMKFPLHKLKTSSHRAWNQRSQSPEALLNPCCSSKKNPPISADKRI